MTGQTPLQPSRQIEAMIRGLTDAARSSGSHPPYSHCWDSELAQQTVRTCSHTQFAREMFLAIQTVSERSCTQQLQSREAVCEIHNLRSKVRRSL